MGVIESFTKHFKVDLFKYPDCLFHSFTYCLVQQKSVQCRRI